MSSSATVCGWERVSVFFVRVGVARVVRGVGVGVAGVLIVALMRMASSAASVAVSGIVASVGVNVGFRTRFSFVQRTRSRTTRTT